MQDLIRATKLDVAFVVKARLHPSHHAKPWMVEYATQTITLYNINTSGGLTTTQIIRGRARATPQARFGEQVLYSIPKPPELATLSLDGDAGFGWEQ